MATYYAGQEEDAPTLEAIPQGFYANSPELPAGTMNDSLAASQPGPQTYGTANDNAYLSELRALANLRQSPQQQRQEQLRKAELEEQSVRTSGQLEYQQLVQGGALPEEAYRRVAGKLNWNHPDKLALALDRIPAQVTTPETSTAVPVMDENGKIIARSVYGRQGHLERTIPVPLPRMPADTTAQQKVAADQMARLSRDLERATKDSETKTGQEQSDATRRALAYRDQLDKLQGQYVNRSTNWQGGATAPQMPPPAETPKEAAKSDLVRVTAPDGKPGTILRSRLKEAIAAGYKEF